MYDIHNYTTSCLTKYVPENICDAAGDEELDVPRVMVEESVVGEVDGERCVVGVGRLVVRLRERLERVRQRLQSPDQLVAPDVLRHLKWMIRMIVTLPLQWQAVTVTPFEI